MAPIDRPTRQEFETLVYDSAVRPWSEPALLARLIGQLAYQEEQSQEGLEELAAALAVALTGDAATAEPRLQRLVDEHGRQPLFHFYLLAGRVELGDLEGAREALDGLARLDSGDPMVELFEGKFAGEPPPDVNEEVRLANIAKFAETPILKNPYGLAVAAIFEAIRDREHARVLDVGVGSGAQMAGLLRLMDREDHRVRRLDVVGLDFMEEFLETAGKNVRTSAAGLGGRPEVSYEPVQGRIERLSEEAAAEILRNGPLDAANASIALHEVPGEAKLPALGNLARLAPDHLVLAEWNYLLENVLPETSVEFLFNIRSVVAAMVAALRDHHGLTAARMVARDWMSQSAGQLTCAADERQECFLDAPVWKALLERSGFELIPPEPSLLERASTPEQARIADEGWYLETSEYAGAVPIALLQARAT